ncbi:MAG: LicD family protein [Ruminococcaceae bacterium]|nr:LicD family protein [Oscillospiraceae bacterium]
MSQTKKLQETLLEILKVTTETLEKHGICPFLIAGSCIGAVRHEGIIPWDDDIDIGLFRKDYEKAREVLRKHLPEGYTYCDERLEDNYPYSFGKVRKDGTAFVHGGDAHLDIHQGVYMDIFPFDAIPDDRKLFLKQYKKCVRLKKMADLKYMSYKKNGHMRPFYQLPLIFAGHTLFSKNRIKKKLHRVITRYSAKTDTKYLFNFLSIYGEKERVEREWFQSLREVSFDGVRAYIPEGYDAYLTFLYGDYMTPPPEDKRVSHHDVVFMSFSEEYKK